MTIVLDNTVYDLKYFLFKTPVLTEDFGAIPFATAFLTKWISGSKEFEIYTSGSTGKAKKIVLKRKWLETSALQTIQLLNLWEENVLCCLPPSKIGGLMMIIRSLAGGFNIHIYEPRADPMIDITFDHSFTFISLVPTQLISILNSEESTLKLNRFRNILLGGADINSELLKKIESLKPNVFHTYGMTETCSHIALKKLNNGAWPHFQPNPYIELKTDKEGLLSIRAFQTGNEWIHTTDVVKIHEDGSFDFIGRADFIINTGGFKVFPEQLEQKIKAVFNKNDWKSNLAITSKPNEKWGEEIILVINNNDTISGDEVLKSLKSHLQKFELPKRIVKMETIPMNESRKIDRIKLRELMLLIA